MDDKELKKALDDYQKMFGNLNIYGLQYPEITVEILQKAIDEKKEIEPFHDESVLY